MNTEQALMTTFCSNFVAYYRTHYSHANTTGRNFFSDHELLGKIYEDLQDEIDTLGELLRTIDVDMPHSLSDIINDSEITDLPVYDDGDGDEYLLAALEDLAKLIDIHLELEDATKDSMEYNHLANYAQDRVKTLHKYLWMVKSTLKGRDRD
ncbi:Dps DNA-binding ferritin-like protein (oxidative damage protectant) [uncultured Caudovirales phage]|uniref:Dps DNA-binding ferritin-like protein (Oxidative damage protectant) n=1 Tax=uncultured Caudovirales phage TaxID=2100421 RepID=A0A6J7WGJ1_9CAUD|nr:Dps DNA-binding ferritin-like protein (oxidative damage protectant) [uncultured Caudovirales phage]